MCVVISFEGFIYRLDFGVVNKLCMYLIFFVVKEQ